MVATRRTKTQVCEFEVTFRTRAMELDAEALIVWPSAQVVLRKKSLDTCGRLEGAIEIARSTGEASEEELGPVLAILAEIARLHWSVVLQHDRLAWKNANRIIGRIPVGLDVEQNDLVQMVRLAMYQAIRRFRPEKGFRYTTYAKWWIQSMAERMSMPIRLSSDMRYLKIQVFQYTRAARENPPTIAELAALTGRTPEQVSVAITSHDLPLSIHATVGNETMSIEDMLQDTEQPGPDVLLERAEVREEVLKLKPQEALVIRHFYGIGAEELTNMQIAERVGLSRERIRQVKNEAMDRLTRAMTRKEEPVSGLVRSPYRLVMS